MRIGIGDTTEPLDALPLTAGGESFYLTPQGGGQVCVPSDPSTCAPGVNIMTGVPLPVNPITGQPVSTGTAQVLNSLSNNSTLIVAACAIGGLLLALVKRR